LPHETTTPLNNKGNHPMARLTFVLSAAAAMLWLAAAGPALAQSKTLYVGMNGGDYERTYTQAVFPAFEKANDVKIVVVPGTSSDIIAKATAAKDKPQMHLMFLDDGVMARAAGMGLCQKLAPGPELSEIQKDARLKDDMAAGVGMGMTGLAYNKKIFDEKGWAAPTSWMDLADPKYKGTVVFQSASASTYGLHAFLMYNRIKGGNEANVEPGFKAFGDEIGKNVLEFIPSSGKISEMVQTGEAAIFPLTPTAVASLVEKNIPVAYAQPKEGSVVLMVAECVIAKNSEPELSQKLAAYLLSVDAQAKALAAGNFMPSNPAAKATTPKAEKELEAFQGYMKTAVTLDWDAINDKRPEWNSRWNKMIER
jgi:putative spermidine/putrescine transport system substrate-binding protein